MNAPFMEADGEAINARAVFVTPYPEHVAELGEIAMLDAFEIGDNPDEWDRYTAEAIEGAAVYLVLPEEVRPSVSKQDLVRALSRFTREHGASLAIVDNYNVLGSAGYFETSAEAVEKPQRERRQVARARQVQAAIANHALQLDRVEGLAVGIPVGLLNKSSLRGNALIEVEKPKARLE